MSVTQTLPHLLLLASLLAPSGLARAQVQPAPRDPYLAARENLEQIEQEERNREREIERRRPPKPAGCSTGQICSQRSEGLQSHQVPGTGLVAVLHDVDVEEGALTVRLRFYNDGPEPATLAIDPTEAFEAYFVEVGGERRFILRDKDGSLEAKKPLARELEPGSMESWWATFAALPVDGESFDLMVPPAPRFEAVSIHSD